MIKFPSCDLWTMKVRKNASKLYIIPKCESKDFRKTVTSGKQTNIWYNHSHSHQNTLINAHRRQTITGMHTNNCKTNTTHNDTTLFQFRTRSQLPHMEALIKSHYCLTTWLSLELFHTNNNMNSWVYCRLADQMHLTGAPNHNFVGFSFDIQEK